MEYTQRQFRTSSPSAFRRTRSRSPVRVPSPGNCPEGTTFRREHVTKRGTFVRATCAKKPTQRRASEYNKAISYMIGTAAEQGRVLRIKDAQDALTIEWTKKEQQSPRERVYKYTGQDLLPTTLDEANRALGRLNLQPGYVLGF